MNRSNWETGFTASEALESEALVNLPNNLARLFYLASLFDRTIDQYVDHSRSPRFGVPGAAKAAERPKGTDREPSSARSASDRGTDVGSA